MRTSEDLELVVSVTPAPACAADVVSSCVSMFTHPSSNGFLLELRRESSAGEKCQGNLKHWRERSPWCHLVARPWEVSSCLSLFRRAITAAYSHHSRTAAQEHRGVVAGTDASGRSKPTPSLNKSRAPLFPSPLPHSTTTAPDHSSAVWTILRFALGFLNLLFPTFSRRKRPRMADDKLKAAFLADLGVANRERLLAAPDTRDVSLRGRLRSNGTGNATAQQSNGSGDASVSNWNQFAKRNKENVGDGDLADLHGGQLHRQNREAMGYGNPCPAPTFNPRPTPASNPRPTPASNTRPAPASFPRPSRSHYNRPQDHTPLSHYDRPSPNFQAPAHVQPMGNGNGARGGTEDALKLARSMQL
ncbi:hypothetical protein IWX90DRAFT_126685 [Phyllosticta citrichinensis]|uniref:Uncharacterized protein n=1 Tax=Phyllosticta citrichinensis TaxID=1130410 RepID=A0ABR1Y4F8_9PEZI